MLQVKCFVSTSSSSFDILGRFAALARKGTIILCFHWKYSLIIMVSITDMNIHPNITQCSGEYYGQAVA